MRDIMYSERPTTNNIEDLNRYIDYLETKLKSLKDNENINSSYNKKLHKELESTKTRYSTLKVKMNELQKELKIEQSKRYDIYVKDDQLSYYELEQCLEEANSQHNSYSMALDQCSDTIKRYRNLLFKLCDTDNIEAIKTLIYEQEILNKKDIKKNIGRPKINERTRALIREMYTLEKFSMNKISKIIGVSVGTVFNILKNTNK